MRHLLSVGPQVGEEVLSGRRRFLAARLRGRPVEPGHTVFLYLARPVSAVAGLFRVGLVLLGPPEGVAAALRELGVHVELGAWRGMAMVLEAREAARCVRPVRARPPPGGYIRLSAAAAARLEEACQPSLRRSSSSPSTNM